MPYKDPAKRKEARARYRAAKKAGKRTGPGMYKGALAGAHGDQGMGVTPAVVVVHPSPAALEIRVKTAGDVLNLLQGQVMAVLGDTDIDTAARARTIGYLCGIMLRAVEAADLTARLEAIEEALASRNATPTPFRRINP